MFLKDLIKKYGRHPVWTDGADWYPPACESVDLKHHTVHAWLVAVEGHGTPDGEAER